MSAGTSRSSAVAAPLEIIGFKPDLPHMRNVEQSGMLAGVLMLRDDPGRILDRHLVTGEGHHFRAQLAMQVRERCALVRLSAEVMMVSALQHKGRSTCRPRGRLTLPSAPSVAGPEGIRRCGTPCRGYSFGETSPEMWQRPLSRVPTRARSFRLRVSGAVAPSAPAIGGSKTTLAGLSRAQGFGLRAVSLVRGRRLSTPARCCRAALSLAIRVQLFL